MNQEQLNAIKERVAKATPAPWYWNKNYKRGVSSNADSEGDIADFWKDDNATADAQFVAHAREDVPLLIEEIERLREENRQLNLKYEFTPDEIQAALHEAYVEKLNIEIAKLREENGKLREALEHIATHNIFVTPQLEIRAYAQKTLEGN